MYKDITLDMQVGTLNQIYDKIFNCMVVKPPYEGEKGIYNTEFFLDKRLGTVSYTAVEGYDSYDHIQANSTEYYLLNNGSQSKLYADNGTALVEVAGPFATDSSSPKKLVKGFNAGGTKTVSGTITVVTTAAAPTTDLGYLAGSFIKLTLSTIVGVTVNQFIFFKSGVLAGTASKILHISGSDIFILQTDTRGTLPPTSTTFDVYPSYKECILVGGTAGLYTILLNGISAANSHLILTTAITDIVEFNSAFFAITDNKIIFSRKTFDCNTAFFPTDRFSADGVEKLCSAGKILFCSGYKNKIISPATDTSGLLGYLEYQANYDERLFSKYSFIYTAGTFYVVNSKNLLRMLDIVTLNSTTYDVIEKEVTYNARGLFESITTGEVFVDADDRYINFCNIVGTTTIIYQYDKQYQHWLLQRFDTKVYNYGAPKVCMTGGVATKTGYTDLGVDYAQEVNFIVNEPNKLIFPVFIRTLFGLTGTERIKLDLDFKYGMGAMLHDLKLPYNNYYFDTNLDGSAEIDNLLGEEENNVYNGNTVSLQNKVMRTGRNFLGTFNSTTRFILGPSYIQAKVSKPYINELLQSN